MLFIGSKPRIYDVMAACDVIIVPSLSEAFGRVVIEAMACGKPVVASRVGGIPEIVEDGKTGILIKPADDKAIADAVIRILSDDKMAEALGTAGKERAARYFDIRSQVKEIERIIDEQLA